MGTCTLQSFSCLDAMSTCQATASEKAASPSQCPNEATQERRGLAGG